VSGAKDHRPKRQALLKAAKQRQLDVILVWKLDRWERSLVDLMTTLHELTALGVGFVSLTEALDRTTPAGRAFAGFLVVFAEFEQDLIREGIKEGITDARKHRKAHGRPRAKANDAAQIRTLAQQGSRPWPTGAGAFTLNELQVMLGDYTLSGVREGGQESIGLNAMTGKGGCDLVTEGAEACVLGNQEEPTAYLQYCNGRSGFEGYHIAVCFGQRELPFLAQPSRRQILYRYGRLFRGWHVHTPCLVGSRIFLQGKNLPCREIHDKASSSPAPAAHTRVG
jgi:hypothetical protein